MVVVGVITFSHDRRVACRPRSVPPGDAATRRTDLVSVPRDIVTGNVFRRAQQESYAARYAHWAAALAFSQLAAVVVSDAAWEPVLHLRPAFPKATMMWQRWSLRTLPGDLSVISKKKK